jgi:hypothetical protein
MVAGAGDEARFQRREGRVGGRGRLLAEERDRLAAQTREAQARLAEWAA